MAASIAAGYLIYLQMACKEDSKPEVGSKKKVDLPSEPKTSKAVNQKEEIDYMAFIMIIVEKMRSLSK